MHHDKPISDLRNKPSKLLIKIKLAEARAQIAEGDKGRPLKEFMKDLRKKIRKKAG